MYLKKKEMKALESIISYLAYEAEEKEDYALSIADETLWRKHIWHKCLILKEAINDY